MMAPNITLRQLKMLFIQSKHLQQIKITKRHNNILVTGYLVEIPSILYLRCEKPSVSKFLNRNT